MENIINIILETNRVLSILNITNHKEKTFKKKINNSIFVQIADISLEDFSKNKKKVDLVLISINYLDKLQWINSFKDIFQFIDYGCIVKLFTPANISNDQQKNFIKKFVNRIDFYFNVDGIVTDKNNKEELFIILKNKILKPKPLNLINNIFDKDAFKKDAFIASKNFKTSTQALSKEVEEVIPFIRNRRHAIDVGARHGIFSCFLLKNNFKKISCFELVPYFREAFLKNTNSNYIDFYNIGLFDSKTRIKFSGRAGKQIQSIGKDGLEVYSLDYFNFKDVDLIKIDVDGCERQILRGARNTIIKHRPVLHIETEEIQLKFDPEGLNKLEDIYSWLLDELDYTSITLERNTILHPKN